MRYVLDTNVLVHLLRGQFGVAEMVERVGWDNCCIAEMSVVELLYGAEVSAQRERNLREVESLISDIEIIPLSVCIREFCQQKGRLQRIGKLIEDYDLFIGATATAMGYTLVTENISHMSRLDGIRLENWVNRKASAKS